jgi:hypothetical protein
MAFLSRDSWVRVPKSHQLGLPRLWNPITLRADLESQWSLKKSCSSCREFSNGMSHTPCNQVNRVDSRLFVVGSQIGSLTPGPSFGHNLCFKCPNEQCKLILNIYVLKAFQWYKDATRHGVLTPEIAFWSFHRDSISQSGSCFGSVRVHSLVLPRTSYTPGSMWYDSWAPSCLDSQAPSWFATLQPFCLGREPKARVATRSISKFEHEQQVEIQTYYY